MVGWLSGTTEQPNHPTTQPPNHPSLSGLVLSRRCRYRPAEAHAGTWARLREEANVSLDADRVDLAVLLERGEVVYYPVCPFPLLDEADRVFLLGQELGRAAHKNISYDPDSGRAGGFARRSAEQVYRLRRILATFSDLATEWLGQALPRYRDGWRLDRVSFRPIEEATRVARLSARNDLIHVDAFPTRPTNGWRLLRVFVNLNPTDARVWVTSEPFAKLLESATANRRDSPAGRTTLAGRRDCWKPHCGCSDPAGRCGRSTTPSCSVSTISSSAARTCRSAASSACGTSRLAQHGWQ